MEIFLSFLPLFLIFLLIVFFKKSAFFSAPITWMVTVLIASLYWGVPVLFISSASIKGLLIATEIMLIILGAIFFLNMMKESKHIQAIEYYLTKVSGDRRVQAILLTWIFGSFLEAAAGFGTPAAIVAPLLVVLGFPALVAVCIALVANSTAVTFGAVGTPILLGFEGLKISTEAVAYQTALLHITGIIVPALLVFTLLSFVKISWKERLEKWKELIPYSLWAGICFLIPYVLSAKFLGPEFPSLIASLVGGTVLVLTTKNNFLTPKKDWHFPHEHVKRLEKPKMSFFKAVSPYLFVSFLLIITRLPQLGLKTFLQNQSTYFNILNTGIEHSLKIIYNPGFLFIVVGLIFALRYRQKIKKPFTMALLKLERPYVTIIFLAAFVQVLIHSGNNTTGLSAMPIIMAGSAAVLFGGVWPFIAVFIGGLGAFVAGSATVSNLLFGSFQLETASLLNLSPIIVLAAHSIGGAIGNMISINNIVTASAIVGIHGEDHKIIRKTMGPFLIYGVIAGFIALIMVL